MMNIKANPKVISLIGMGATVVIWCILNLIWNSTGVVVNNIWIAAIFVGIAYLIADLFAGIVSANVLLKNVDSMIEIRSKNSEDE